MECPVSIEHELKGMIPVALSVNSCKMVHQPAGSSELTEQSPQLIGMHTGHVAQHVLCTIQFQQLVELRHQGLHTDHQANDCITAANSGSVLNILDTP